ncbi:sortase [Candidatus Gracilibacteria bacterium]|nr:MAG: sortase [Candidatus Gracilibacteria bacterium]
MIKKLIIFVFSVYFILVNIVYGGEDTSISQKEIFQKVGVRLNKNVETYLPDASNFDLAGSKEIDFSFWAKKLDKGEDLKGTFIVIPSQGVVMPLLNLSADDNIFKEYMDGKDKKLNDKMGNGALLIPVFGEKPFGKNGNKLIGGHSSYFKSRNGKYKTHFQKIIGLKGNDLIYVYKYDEKAKIYDLYKYKVNSSYNLNSNRIELVNDERKDIITLFTCTPIGGVSGRWIVEAERI